VISNIVQKQLDFCTNLNLESLKQTINQGYLIKFPNYWLICKNKWKKKLSTKSISSTNWPVVNHWKFQYFFLQINGKKIKRKFIWSVKINGNCNGRLILSQFKSFYELKNFAIWIGRQFFYLNVLVYCKFLNFNCPF